MRPLLQAQTSVPRTGPQNRPSPAAHGLRGRAPGASPEESGCVLGPVRGGSGGGPVAPSWGSEEGGPGGGPSTQQVHGGKMIAKMTGSRARAAPQDRALTPTLLPLCIPGGADFNLSRTFFIFLTCSQRTPRGAEKTQVLIRVCCLPAGWPWASPQRCRTVFCRLNGGHRHSHVPGGGHRSEWPWTAHLAPALQGPRGHLSPLCITKIRRPRPVRCGASEL